MGANIPLNERGKVIHVVGSHSCNLGSSLYKLSFCILFLSCTFSNQCSRIKLGFSGIYS